ncbi:MAG: InlB B-repeat-containing protein, partial [Clostridiales bacterium]|nr:InlB B-repeat-containing protein [Clostridiales bacterium]
SATQYIEYRLPDFTVSFEDWDGTLLDSQIIPYGLGATAPDDPERVGHTFAGWDEDFSFVTADLTVTAQYTANVYTVSFYKQSQDNSNKVAKAPFATQDVTYGELIDFTKVSVGKNAVWYFTDGTTFGAKFDLSTPVTGDLMLAVKDQNSNQQ